MPLEEDLLEIEKQLHEIRTIRFKLWCVGRLAWTYIKSVLGFFIPNTLVLVIAGSLIGIIAPSNVPKEWISSWVPTGWGFVLVFGGVVLYVIVHEEVTVQTLFIWLCSAIIFGIFCSVPYLLIASDDPTVLYNGYATFTFVGTPLIFMFRRALIMWKDIKSLPSVISSLKQQIKEKETFRENMRKKGYVPIVDRYGEVKWGTPSQVKEWKKINGILDNNFAGYTPFQFRNFTAELFRRMGYDCEDLGSHVIAKKNDERLLIKAEKYTEGSLVGNKEVRDVIGSIYIHKANKAIFITTSDFTEYAYEQARNSPIELWNRQKLTQFIRKAFEEKMLKFEDQGVKKA
jgi:hypothetical protein